MPSVSRLSSTHWAVTREVSRLMVGVLLAGGEQVWTSGGDVRCRSGGDATEKQVDLASQAEGEDGVEEGGDEREPDGHLPHHGGSGEEGDQPDEGEREADALREA